jgi:DNA-binding MarR family transcriptional regulator
MKFEEAIHQKKFNSPLQKAVLNLVYTANWFRDQQRTIFKDHPIEPQHFNVLRIIKGRHPEPVCPGDIKAVMLDKAPDITRLCDRLVKLGWVRREVAGDDRRKVEIRLTAKGLKDLGAMNAEIERSANQWKGRLTDAEAEKLSALLDKLRG